MLVERRVDGVGRVYQKDRVAIGRRLGDRFGREIVAGSWAVLDNELLAETLAEPIAEQPRADVGRATGRIADNDMRLPCRIIGSIGIASRHKPDAGRRESEPRNDHQNPLHVCILPGRPFHRAGIVAPADVTRRGTYRASKVKKMLKIPRANPCFFDPTGPAWTLQPDAGN